MPEVTFYFDLGSPYAYLAAERLAGVLPGPAQWQPVLLGGLFQLCGRSSWARDEERRRAGMAEIERRADRYGLPPIRWPRAWPTDYLFAMRAATYAFACGRGEEFSLQAFRSAFQGGADLGEPAEVLEAGVRAGMRAAELEAGALDPDAKAALRRRTDAAFARGVTGVPTVVVDGEVFWGDDRLAAAASYLRSVTAG